MLKKKVTVNFNEDQYFEYKKILIDQRTNPSADLARYISMVVDNPENSATAKAKKEQRIQE